MELERDGFASSPSSSSSISSSPAHKRKGGRKKFRETRHPVYRGVRQRNGNKWVCEVREPHNKSRIWVGTFPTPEMAARAHDVAALAFKGDVASLNFPDSSSRLPRAKSASPQHIQAAALEAARAFGHAALASSSSSSSPFQDVAGCGKVPETEAQSSSAEAGGTPVFVDEEELFNMPAFINSMAEGLLLAPPALSGGFSWEDDDGEDMASHMDLSLWNDG